LRGRPLLLPAIAVALLWAPLLQPIGRSSLLVLDIYSSALWDRNLAAAVTPAPRVSDERLVFTGVAARVTWWRPGWGDRHPGILLVNGATPRGNDEPETRRLGDALARAGFLVMLPEFPFMVRGHFDPTAPAQIDEAFAALLARREARPDVSGAFGFSVGGGLLLAGAARGAALSRAAYLGALGAYYDINTYLASVIGSAQERGGRIMPWTPSEEARTRLPRAAIEALADARDREMLGAALASGTVSGEPPSDLGPEGRGLWSALGARDYATALDRLKQLPPSLRERFDALSPRSGWGRIAAPVYWLHDEGDTFEPVAEGEHAASRPHPGRTRLQLTRLLSHAAALSDDARREGVGFWVSEIGGLIGFSTELLRGTG
jgi:dienelactone hydrolase